MGYKKQQHKQKAAVKSKGSKAPGDGGGEQAAAAGDGGARHKGAKQVRAGLAWLVGRVQLSAAQLCHRWTSHQSCAAAALPAAAPAASARSARRVQR